MGFFAYIMANNRNGVLYVGVTNDLQRRVWEHRQGLIEGFTSRYNAKKLVYFEQYSDVKQAIAREKSLKLWARSKKKWLIERRNSEWVDLVETGYVFPHDAE